MTTYLKQLRETIVECYTSIVHGVTTSDNPQDKLPLIKYSQSLLQFLAQASDKAYNPSKDLVKNILGLIGDLAECIGREIKDQLRQPFIE